jgi:hypothetical protein
LQLKGRAPIGRMPRSIRGQGTTRKANMSAQTYAAIIDAVQTHVAEEHGDSMYARDWVLACGIEPVTPNTVEPSVIRVIKSPRAAAYSMTGLLSWAIDLFIPSEPEADDDE